MKNIIIILLLTSLPILGQFKKDLENSIDIPSSITNSSPSGFLLDFLASDNFKMNHTIGMSYSSFGNEGVALGVYTNNMAFRFGERFDAEIEMSLVNSPYSSFGQEHQKAINGIYLSRAQLNYRPTKSMAISVAYRQLPAGYYSPYGYSNFGRSSFGNFFED